MDGVWMRMNEFIFHPTNDVVIAVYELGFEFGSRIAYRLFRVWIQRAGACDCAIASSHVVGVRFRAAYERESGAKHHCGAARHWALAEGSSKSGTACSSNSHLELAEFFLIELLWCNCCRFAILFSCAWTATTMELSSIALSRLSWCKEAIPPELEQASNLCMSWQS